MQKGKHISVWTLTIAFLLVVGGTAFSIHQGVSQFAWTKGDRGHSNGARITNPTRDALRAIAIAYATDESFLFCEDFLLTPHGTAEVSNLSDRGIIEVVAFPATANNFVFNHARGIVLTGGKGRSGQIVDPQLFSVEDSSAVDCICNVLNNNGHPLSFFNRHGIKCAL